MERDIDMAKKYLLGIDIGSSAVKTTLITTSGDFVATASREYTTYYPQVAWAEQDPEDWIKAFREDFKEILCKTGVKPSDIVAVAPDAATHTSVLMDSEFNVLRKAILWTDQRSRKESAFLHGAYGQRIFELAYHRPDPMWTMCQLLWVKNNQPDIWNKIRKILFAKDYFRYRLTGEFVTDRIDALGSMFLNAKTGAWSQELCDMIGLPIDTLPPVVEPVKVIGAVTSAGARDTGLAEGTLVVAGTSDTALEVFAAGAVRTGQSTIKLATSGRICVITDRAFPNPMLVNYYHLVDGKWYPGTGTKACATSFRWYRDTFGDYEELISKDEPGADSYRLLDEAAGDIGVGCDGLFYHPYLLGELTPYMNPLLKASFTSISSHHTKAHFTRAVLEGTAYSLGDCLNTLRTIGLQVENARIIGGGAKSTLWRQIVADVLGIELSTPELSDSSFGAAMLAGVGIGAFSGFEQAADQCVRIKFKTSPNMENHAVYQKFFTVYKQIQSQLEPVYNKLAEMMEELKENSCSNNG